MLSAASSSCRQFLLHLVMHYMHKLTEKIFSAHQAVTAFPVSAVPFTWTSRLFLLYVGCTTCGMLLGYKRPAVEHLLPFDPTLCWQLGLGKYFIAGLLVGFARVHHPVLSVCRLCESPGGDV